MFIHSQEQDEDNSSLEYPVNENDPGAIGAPTAALQEDQEPGSSKPEDDHYK